jgi:hypothetical protein
MKIQSIGNWPIKSTVGYWSKKKQSKAQRVLGEIVRLAFPDCHEFSMTQHGWHSSFSASQVIVEKFGIRLVCEKSELHEGRVYFAMLSETETI